MIPIAEMDCRRGRRDKPDGYPAVDYNLHQEQRPNWRTGKRDHTTSHHITAEVITATAGTTLSPPKALVLLSAQHGSCYITKRRNEKRNKNDECATHTKAQEE